MSAQLEQIDTRPAHLAGSSNVETEGTEKTFQGLLVAVALGIGIWFGLVAILFLL